MVAGNGEVVRAVHLVAIQVDDLALVVDVPRRGVRDAVVGGAVLGGAEVRRQKDQEGRPGGEE